MIKYVADSNAGVFRPDRRVAQTTPLNGERRSQEPATTTSEQYAFLRDCFERRELMRAALGKGERYARHFIVATAMIFAVIYFAAPDFAIKIDKVGVKITLTQVAAVAPLLIAYLIIHACILGARRLRLNQECMVLDAELQRFGCETGYSLLEHFHRECETLEGKYRAYYAPKLYRRIYWTHDVFIGFSGLFAMVGSIVIAIETYASLKNTHQLAIVGFFAYLLIAALASVVAPALLYRVRKQKQKVLQIYLRGLTGKYCSENVAPAAKAS